MVFLSGFYWEESGSWSLLLQQAIRRRGNVPILFACILDGKSRGQSAIRDLKDWFYGCALPKCEKRDEKSAVEALQRLFCGKIQCMQREQVLAKECAFAAFFGMGTECFYAWRGNVQICLSNRLFDRVRVRNLTEFSEEMVCERAYLEEGAGLVLGAQDFFAHLTKEELQACLDVQGMQNDVQVKRHLAEIAQKAGRLGAKETACVLTVSQLPI